MHRCSGYVLDVVCTCMRSHHGLVPACESVLFLGAMKTVSLVNPSNQISPLTMEFDCGSNEYDCVCPVGSVKSSANCFGEL